MNNTRKVIPIILMGVPKPFNPVCQDEHCPEKRECANHRTAGEFREESGFTPRLLREQDGSWTCDQEQTKCQGMLVWDRKRKTYIAYSSYED